MLSPRSEGKKEKDEDDEERKLKRFFFFFFMEVLWMFALVRSANVAYNCTGTLLLV